MGNSHELRDPNNELREDLSAVRDWPDLMRME
jgi:hypothetical protein